MNDHISIQNNDISKNLVKELRIQGAGVLIICDGEVILGVKYDESKKTNDERTEYSGGKPKIKDLFFSNSNNFDQCKTEEEVIEMVKKFKSESPDQFEQFRLTVAFNCAMRETEEEFMIKLDKYTAYVFNTVDGTDIFLFLSNTTNITAEESVMKRFAEYQSNPKDYMKTHSEIPPIKSLHKFSLSDYVSDINRFMAKFNENPKQNPSNVSFSESELKEFKCQPLIRGLNGPMVYNMINNCDKLACSKN